jgi:hypothetical protein
MENKKLKTAIGALLVLAAILLTSCPTGLGGNNKVAMPVFNPGSCSFTGSQSIAISCGTSGAQIFYTLDGSPPGSYSFRYYSSFTVSQTTTVRAIATKIGYSDSSVAQAIYTLSGGGLNLLSPANWGSVTETRPTLDWSDVIGSTGYEVQITDWQYNIDGTAAISTSASQYQLPAPLANPSTKYWRVRSLDAEGNPGSWSDTWSFNYSWTPTIYYQSPGWWATVADTTPLLDWDDVAGAAKYDIQIADSESATSTATILSSTSSQYNMTTVVPLGAYRYWHVRAINGDGDIGAWGSIQVFYVDWNPYITLNSPYNSEEITKTTPLLDWSDDSSAAKYQVQMADSSDALTDAAPIAATVTDSQYQLPPESPIANGATKYWRVRAVNADEIAGKSWSSIWYFSVNWNPSLTSPTAPGNGGQTTSSSPLLDWPDTSDTASYELQIADAEADVPAAATIPTAVSEYQIPSDIPYGTTKHWRVRPINASGAQGAWSPTWSFTVDNPIGVTIVTDLQNPATITFSGVDPDTPFTLFKGASITVTANLSVAADTYIWRLNGKIINSVSGATITLKNAADSGLTFNLGFNTLTLQVRNGGRELGSKPFYFQASDSVSLLTSSDWRIL